MKRSLVAICVTAGLVVSATTLPCGSAYAGSTAEDINKDADQALQSLLRTNAVAAGIAKQSREFAAAVAAPGAA